MNENELEELLVNDPLIINIDDDGNETYDAFDQDTDYIDANMGWD